MQLDADFEADGCWADGCFLTESRNNSGSAGFLSSGTSRPGTGSLCPVAIGAAVEVTKLPKRAGKNLMVNTGAARQGFLLERALFNLLVWGPLDFFSGLGYQG